MGVCEWAYRLVCCMSIRDPSIKDGSGSKSTTGTEEAGLVPVQSSSATSQGCWNGIWSLRSGLRTRNRDIKPITLNHGYGAEAVSTSVGSVKGVDGVPLGGNVDHTSSGPRSDEGPAPTGTSSSTTGLTTHTPDKDLATKEVFADTGPGTGSTRVPEHASASQGRTPSTVLEATSKSGEIQEGGTSSTPRRTKESGLLSHVRFTPDAEQPGHPATPKRASPADGATEGQAASPKPPLSPFIPGAVETMDEGELIDHEVAERISEREAKQPYRAGDLYNAYEGEQAIARAIAIIDDHKP